MNIWTGLVFLEGALPDADLARELAATERSPQTLDPIPASRREQEVAAARAAVPLWRPAPGIALR